MEDFQEEPLFSGFDKLKHMRAACFVSLHCKKEGDEVLRGCIGTLAPAEKSLYDEICANAHSAAFNDPRFPPLEKTELEDLIVSVDVLTPSKPIKSISSLNPKIYGVIVEKDFRRGVLLPDLEGVNTAEEQVAIARKKAHILPEEKVNLYRFKVTRYF
jgi:AmmeMemoRadiSam system protein A